ncbi:SIMPL domain-containing protein [Myroides sp. LJL119]
MKKISLLYLGLILGMSMPVLAQNTPSLDVPQISVTGNGKLSVVPDKVEITLGITNQDPKAEVAKKANDQAIAKVLAYLKTLNLNHKDIQTKAVSLYKTTDYETKQESFTANQSIVVTLNDISLYEKLMLGVMENGVNNISGVTFMSSKADELQKQTRVLAVQDAKEKASDYANALGQKVGKAIYINDGSVSGSPMPRAYMLKSSSVSEYDQTIAIGELEITSNVSISFELK